MISEKSRPEGLTNTKLVCESSLETAAYGGKAERGGGVYGLYSVSALFPVLRCLANYIHYEHRAERAYITRASGLFYSADRYFYPFECSL